MIVATAQTNGRGAGELRLKHEQAYEAIRMAIVRLDLAPSRPQGCRQGLDHHR